MLIGAWNLRAKCITKSAPTESGTEGSSMGMADAGLDVRRLSRRAHCRWLIRLMTVRGRDPDPDLFIANFGMNGMMTMLRLR
jgi:hypothetical protein